MSLKLSPTDPCCRRNENLGTYIKNLHVAQTPNSGNKRGFRHRTFSGLCTNFPKINPTAMVTKISVLEQTKLAAILLAYETSRRHGTTVIILEKT